MCGWSPARTTGDSRAHFMRNALSLVPQGASRWWELPSVPSSPSPMQLVPISSGGEWPTVFRCRFPKLADLMDSAEEDVLAYAAFPQEHWQKIWSNNPLERLNKEVKRRTNVVGIFGERGSGDPADRSGAFGAAR